MARNPRPTTKWLGAMAGAIFTTFLGLAIHYNEDLQPFRDFAYTSYNLPYLFKLRYPPNEVIVVYMDDESHKDLQQPHDRPWNRGLHARLVDRLTADAARAVVFDVVFSGPNQEFPEGDEAFARALKANGKVVLGADLTMNPDGSWTTTRPADPFVDAAHWGIVQLQPDQDLIVRRHFHHHPYSIQPSLTWVTAELLGAEATRNPEQQSVQRWMNYYVPQRVGPERIQKSLPGVSFKDALEPNTKCPAGFFRNKVVFIGGNLKTFYSGMRKDEYRTPFTRFGELIPGVDVQATQFLNLLRGDWLRKTPASVELAAILAGGILFGFGLMLMQPWRAARVALFSVIGVAILTQYLFVQHRLWWPWLIVAAVQIPAATFYAVVLNSFRLFLQKRMLEQSLALHLPPKRIKQFVRQPELLKPGASKQMLSIMFTDIEDFTKMSEGMDSDVLARVMNEYFEMKIPCVHQADGTVIKLIGDAILAVWNAPDQQPNHRELACRGALLLHNEVVRFTGDQAGLKLRTRIGVHTGLANVGNFGSATRIDYTAIGENVNLASRLEGLNKYLGTNILISRETREGTGERVIVRAVGLFRLKGFEKAVEVFELLGFPEQVEASRAWREAFEQALKEFQQQNFDAAERGFRCTLEAHPNDGPAKFYLHQIAELRAHPPTAGWAGEVELKEK